MMNSEKLNSSTRLFPVERKGDGTRQTLYVEEYICTGYYIDVLVHAKIVIL